MCISVVFFKDIFGVFHFYRHYISSQWVLRLIYIVLIFWVCRLRLWSVQSLHLWAACDLTFTSKLLLFFYYHFNWCTCFQPVVFSLFSLLFFMCSKGFFSVNSVNRSFISPLTGLSQVHWDKLHVSKDISHFCSVLLQENANLRYLFIVIVNLH